MCKPTLPWNNSSRDRRFKRTMIEESKRRKREDDMHGACGPLHSAFAYLMYDCERECVALAMQKLEDKPYNTRSVRSFTMDSTSRVSTCPTSTFARRRSTSRRSREYNFAIKLVKKDLTNFDMSILGPRTTLSWVATPVTRFAGSTTCEAKGMNSCAQAKDVYWYRPDQGIYGKDWGSWNTFAQQCPCIDEEYQVSTRCQKMMREQIFGHVESATSGEFHRRVFDSTHRRIAFQNGVYDFEKGELVDFSPDYMFDRKANVDYNPNLVELEKEVYQKLFVDIVGDEVGEYFIKLLARGLAGEYEDKAFVVLVGLGNSGLGTLTSALSRTFGSYVKNFQCVRAQGD